MAVIARLVCIVDIKIALQVNSARITTGGTFPFRFLHFSQRIEPLLPNLLFPLTLSTGLRC
jgi:hypothetical protein